MSETRPGPTPARTFTTTSSINACRLRREDLLRLYRIINERQVEYGQLVVNFVTKLPEESPEQFHERRTRLASSFVTTVNVTGANGEVVSGSGESFVISDNIPEHILTVFYTTMEGPNTIGITPQMLTSKATILLDFSRPTLRDFSRLTTAADNNSNFSIVSTSEPWFTLLNTRLVQFFNERPTRFGWLHQAGIYDFLLLIIGLPFAFWVVYRFSESIHTLRLPNVLATALYIYVFLGGVWIFQIIFKYSRWVFPKIELQTETSPPRGHRLVWMGIVTAVFGGAIWDAIKALW
jgi:hypothetical protein